LPILGGTGRCPPTTVGWQKTRRIALSCCIKISPVGSLDESQSTPVTDGQTDRQDYNSQDRASIAASHGKNQSTFGKVMDNIIVACFFIDTQCM